MEEVRWGVLGARLQLPWWTGWEGCCVCVRRGDGDGER